MRRPLVFSPVLCHSWSPRADYLPEDVTSELSACSEILLALSAPVFVVLIDSLEGMASLWSCWVWSWVLPASSSSSCFSPPGGFGGPGDRIYTILMTCRPTQSSWG